MIHDNVIYQDNQSVIKLENNGMRSIRKRTSHINIMYFFITDSIINQEASVENCPTFDMIGDYFTKALQGSQFRQLRNIIIGIHKDIIPAYNASGGALLEKRKLKFKKEKEEAQEADKITGTYGNQ